MDPSKPSRAAERREALLAAAVRLFAERGFEGVTIRQIGQAVGVTEPIVYKHFASKEALYRAILEREVERSRNADKEFIALCEEPLKPEDFIRRMIPMVLNWMQSDPHFAWLAIRSSVEQHEAGRLIRNHLQATYFQRLRKVFDEHVLSGSLRPVSTVAATYILTAVLRLYTFDIQILDRQYTMPESIEDIFDVLWHGLKPIK